MSVVIWKYVLPVLLEQVLDVPRGFRPLSVGVQHGALTLWAEVEYRDASPTVQRRVRVIGTGDKMPNMAGFKFVGSTFMGPFVWHVYAEES